MAFGQPSWIARHLLGEDLAQYAFDVRVEVTQYGNTTGPYGGIGGAAVSSFTMTALVLHVPADMVRPTRVDETPAATEVALYFCDEAFLGWATGNDIAILAGEFPRLDVRSPHLDTDPATCPVALPEPADSIPESRA